MTAPNDHDRSHGTHPESGPGDHGHAHEHPPHLAHHFDTPEQQYNSAKIGMWVFLATEILMFGGLFCAYAVYRYNNPDVFRYSEHHLNTWLGTTNTVVLLASSLTMALAVRAAQLGQQGKLKLLLALTLLGGVGFMAIKTVEYTEKFSHGLFPGRWNVYDRQQNEDGYAAYFAQHHNDEEHEEGGAAHGADETLHLDPGEPAAETDSELPLAETIPEGQALTEDHPRQPNTPVETPAQNFEPPLGQPLAWLGPEYVDPHLGSSDAALVRPTFNSPKGLNPAEQEDGHAGVEYTDLSIRDRSNVKTFFNIYFMMTGLHGLHVLIGMGLIGWVLVKATAGVFGPAYFTPVDIVGLYWHLVDLIWIFLFPLLYLIH